MRRYTLGPKASVDVVIAAVAKRFHQRLVATISHRKYRYVRRLDIGMQNFRQIERTHLPHAGGTDDRCRRTPFQHRQRIRDLRAVRYLKALNLQRISETLREKDVAVDDEYLGCGCRFRAHARAPFAINFSSSITSTISSFRLSSPTTYSGRRPVGCVISAAVSSHSPVTGRAVSSTCSPNVRLAIR